jgi:predicted ribosome quality control (RQC) complex YloA/Tae2 family protein
MLEIEPLSNSVKVLQSSSSIIIPVDPELDISRLQTGARIASEITSLQRSISLMEAEVEIPAPVNKENSQKFLRARQLLSEITAAEKDIKKGEDSLKQYDDELQTVLDELSKIPTCPTCQQVCADIHSHNV